MRRLLSLTLLTLLPTACGTSEVVQSADVAATSHPLEVLDPSNEGPFATAALQAVAHIESTGDDVSVRVFYASGQAQQPVVVFAPGFKIPAEQYDSYLERLASFGYVALSVAYPSSYLGNNNPREAAALLGVVDWITTEPTLAPLSDTSRVGMSGHSLGGKLALLAATQDTRVVAALTFDPVDGGAGSCHQPKCVTVATLLANLHIATGFLGETTDQAGGHACAPADANYTTFYAQALSPSFAVTIAGAAHLSFLDDVQSCGLVCNFCKTPTAPDAQVGALARAYFVAFHERWLRGSTGYDTYLTGAKAHARFVDTAQAEIAFK